MKNKKLTFTIMIILAITILFIIFKIQYTYKVGILYSQNDLPGYNEKQLENSDLITRNKAIEISTHIIKDIIGVDMTDGNPTMNVNIYKNNYENGTYNWNVWWVKENSIEKYGVVINANTGEISNVFVNYDFKEENTEGIPNLSQEEIIDIIKPFTNYIKVNLDNYNMEILDINYYYINGIKIPYQHCLFSNEKNNDIFFIKLDLKSKKIIDYEKNILEGTIYENISSGR